MTHLKCDASSATAVNYVLIIFFEQMNHINFTKKMNHINWGSSLGMVNLVFNKMNDLIIRIFQKMI